MIYRFKKTIDLPEFQKLIEGEAIIVDGELDDKHPIHACIKDAISKGLLDESEPKIPKAIKQKTQ